MRYFERKSSAEPLGSIELRKHCSVFESSIGEHTICISTEKRKYYFEAKSKKEMLIWMSAIKSFL